ncbi:hypothetical protein A2W14_02245 [Candidatus Gottesmanbacteria bacterium RBG_16_37_8]|uniref:PglD N-terminal domain-containing protein n=1 Tax=Candidatus Gottesmanbacteria bacterium RBG_16_37_8 TaxID=1798371 RepID=A0A1F5YRH4_9BACT|nr:MAG: hypothetical protein A2W14_02245 [Candidatus Gottesmanbacteria bacterium RBG_16_37_8]
MKEIYLIGIQTSYISEAIEICELSGYKKIILVDNLNNYRKKEIDGHEVFFLSKLLKSREKFNYCCCLHTPIFREKIVKALPSNFVPTSIIHPTAVISKKAIVSTIGVIIGANAVIGSHSIISDYVIINRGALIGHDVKLLDFSVIESGAILAGLSIIGRKSFVAMGAKILPKITIGQNAVVGAGAVVRTNVFDRTLVAGVPAVVKKKNIEGYIGTG